MEIQEIAGADFIFLREAKTVLRWRRRIRGIVLLWLIFIMIFLIIASIFPEVSPIHGKIVYGATIFSLPAAIFFGLRYKAVEYICDFAFSRSGTFVIPIIVEIITMLIIVPIVLFIGCAKLMRLKLF